MRNKILSLLSIAFLGGCQNATIKAEENIIVDSNKINIKYMNFSPKKVDNECLEKSIKKLFYAIDNDEVSIYKSIFFMKHNQYKKISLEEGVIIENIQKNKFVLLPFNKGSFFLSNKPFDKDNDGTFSMYELLIKIDFKSCISVL